MITTARRTLFTLLLLLCGVGVSTADTSTEYFVKGDGATHVLNIRDCCAWSELKSNYAWTITMDVEASAATYNQWGSSLLTTGSNPLPTSVGNGFQIYLTKDGTVKLNGLDTGMSVAQNFTVELRYTVGRLYGHFVGKDTNGNDKETGANGSWYFTATIANFSQISYALPVGVNIKSLTITSEEPLNYAPNPSTLDAGTPYVTGNGEVQQLKAKYYITNRDENDNLKYNAVPEGKAWQTTMVVMHAPGQKASYNQYGSCILSSSADPINTYYWNNFQIFEHSGNDAGTLRGTLNFKSNKGDGNDHIIAQGHKVYTNEGYENYKVIVRYDGKYTYIIRTIILEADGETIKQDAEGHDMVFNNVWFAARVQHDIDVMSCALPVGTNIKSLAISIAEESNLMEDMDYAIQNITTKDYLLGTQHTQGAWYGPNAGDAARYQIEWTNNNDLTYTDTDGGLHHSFYIRLVDSEGNTKYLGANNENVESKDDAVTYIYSENSKKVQPISAKNNVGDSWTIDGADTWLWDFFANFYVEVAGNNTGGLNYLKGGEKQTATNGTYIELPSGVDVARLSNKSCLGYSAAISKADIRLKVQYTALANTFYNIAPKTSGAQPTLYYWYKDQNKLVLYSNGTDQSSAWDEEQMGDCSKYSIVAATTIPVNLSKNKNDGARDAYHYGTLYSPVAYILPEGVDAYIVKRIPDVGSTTMLLRPFKESGEIVPARTGVVLYKEDVSDVDPIAETIKLQANCTEEAPEENVLTGLFITGENPKDGTYYTLGRTKGMGFYRYTGAKLTAFKAFYHSATGGSSSYVFDFDHEPPTGLEQLDAVQDTHAAYDLQGRRLTQPKGLFISNGRIILSK